MNDLVRTLQDYLRRSAARSKKVLNCPPFRLYLHPSDDFRFFNYAIPDHPVGALSSSALADVREAFGREERDVRFEFLHEYTPCLRAALEALGVPLESENPLLVCTHESSCALPSPLGLEIRRLDANSAIEDLAASINTVHRAFGDEGRDANEERIADLRRRISLGNAYFVAFLENVPAGVGAYTAPMDGLTELVGVGTLEPYRGRGIAAAVTAEMVRVAFKEGVEIAFLTAADDDASRVYQRAGFHRIGTGLAFWEAE